MNSYQLKYQLQFFRTGSTNSRGGLRRRSSAKKPVETNTTAAATAANTKLIDAEKAETGKVITMFPQ
jgi:hypothetical protein